MKKQMLKIVGLSFVVMFFSLYFMQLSNYNNYAVSQKNLLTNEAIKRFEDDVRNGVEIEKDNYLVKEKNYNNSFTYIGMKLSNIIEKNFNKTMNKIFKEITDVVNE